MVDIRIVPISTDLMKISTFDIFCDTINSMSIGGISDYDLAYCMPSHLLVRWIPFKFFFLLKL